MCIEMKVTCLMIIFIIGWFWFCAQAIQEQMKLHGQEPVSFQDVKDEIFDMVKPADPLKLTLQDLINRWAVLCVPLLLWHDYLPSSHSTFALCSCWALASVFQLVTKQWDKMQGHICTYMHTWMWVNACMHVHKHKHTHTHTFLPSPPPPPNSQIICASHLCRLHC